jgi:hypothetical protein
LLSNDDTESPNDNNHERPDSNQNMRRLWNWFYTSFLLPERINQFLTVLATAALVVFAWRAWTEAQNTTRAIQGQLDVMKADQRPLMWITDAEAAPQFHDDTGQISWSFAFNNIGRSMAYNVVWTTYIKIGNEPFQKGRSGNSINAVELLPAKPTEVPPLTTTRPYGTIFSRSGIGKDYFSNLLTANEGIGILVISLYRC